MTGLILYNSYNSHPSIKNQVKRLKEEFNKLNVNVDVNTTDIYPCLISEKLQSRINAHYDFIIYLDKDRYISRALEKAGFKLFNSSDAIEICDDKMITHIELSNKGIPMPKTMAGLLCYVHKAVLSDKSIKTIENEFEYPFIVKESFGSLGNSVYLVKNRRQFIRLSKQLIKKPHIYQEFIKTSYGTDVRAICVGGKAIACMQRKSYNDFRSNIELGGEGLKFDLPLEFKNVAEKVAQILNLDYCGIDILFGENNKPIICEVNSNAFFKKIEEVTGENVAKAYAEHVVKTMSKKG